MREIIENLVHADFRDALVSVLSNGHVVRVSDSGPGIADPGSGDATRVHDGGRRASASMIRGVGCGLPLAASVMDAEGGTIEFSRNLRGGTVVTLTTPNHPIEDDSESSAMPAEDDRLVMALLLEMGPSLPERLAAELSWTVGRCGRELVVLESRGLVSRDLRGAARVDPERVAPAVHAVLGSLRERNVLSQPRRPASTSPSVWSDVCERLAVDAQPLRRSRSPSGTRVHSP